MTTFTHHIRVRYAETDAQGIAHHSAYVPWLEEARIEALRAIGHDYAKLEKAGVFMPVLKVEVSYKKSASFDEVIRLETTVSPEGRFKLTFTTDMTRDGALLARGMVEIASIDVDGRLQPMPADIVAAFV